MVDFHTVILMLISLPAEALLRSNHLWCLLGTIVVAGLLVSPTAALLSSFASLWTLLATFRRRACPLPRYSGSLDVLLGRSHRASTKTPDAPANNNVSLASFNNRFVVAYRKAESHFACPTAKIIVATADGKKLDTWEVIWEYQTGQDDLREMYLFHFQNQLFLYFARLEPFKRGFKARGMDWCSTKDLKVWTEPTAFGKVGEIVWDVKVHKEGSGKEVAYKASYVGNHYMADPVVTVFFEKSVDGVNWEAVDGDGSVYVGGVTEVSFAFTPGGDLVAIGRNEDGDHTGFGSQLFFASKGSLGVWKPLKVSMPYRFDSPRMVCMEGEVLLFARYAFLPYNLVPAWMPIGLQRIGNLVSYSALPKAAAIYRLRLPDASGSWPEHPVEVVRLLETTFSDTGFFSLAQDAGGDYVVANYAAHCHSHASWVYGQLFDTDIYVCSLRPLRNK